MAVQNCIFKTCPPLFSLRAPIREAGWPSSPVEDATHSYTQSFFCSIVVIKIFHKCFCSDSLFKSSGFSDKNQIWLSSKHLLQLCHCWKETLLVTNTETQGTTEDAQNSAGDIIATWAHGGGAWLWNCCEHEKWQKDRRKGAINWFVFLAAAVSLISTSTWGGFECSMNVWFLCCSVFLSAVDQRFSLHQQLSVSQLKFSLSLHLPLHVLPQGLKHTQID